jgi:hypothetical protein
MRRQRFGRSDFGLEKFLSMLLVSKTASNNKSYNFIKMNSPIQTFMFSSTIEEESDREEPGTDKRDKFIKRSVN